MGIMGFNTQPRGGGCEEYLAYIKAVEVSTHSRPEAAALTQFENKLKGGVSTHSRAEAAAY